MNPADVLAYASYLLRGERRHLAKRRAGLARSFGAAADFTKVDEAEARCDAFERWVKERAPRDGAS